MKNLLLLLFVITAFISCVKDEEIILQTKETESISVSTESVNKDEQKQDSESAKLSIILEGRDTYRGIWVSIRIGENNNILDKFDFVSNKGEKSFDVTQFIGQELVIKIHKKDGEAISFIQGTTRKINIEKNANSIRIKMPAEKIYAANLKVIKAGKAQPGVVVYAFNKLVADVLLQSIKLRGSEALSSVKNVITDSEGIAKFEHLDVGVIYDYVFIIITKEPVLFSGCEFQSLNLTLDGSLRNGTIDIPLPKKGGLKFTLDTSFPVGVKAELKNNVLTIIATIISENETGEFTDIPVGEYYVFVSKYSACFSPKNNFFDLTIKEDVVINKKINFEKPLELTCTSDNPYTVTITCSDNTTRKFVMNGKEVKGIDIPLGTTGVHVKQNSGFLFYPTQKNFEIKPDCNEIVKLSFPD